MKLPPISLADLHALVLSVAMATAGLAAPPLSPDAPIQVSRFHGNLIAEDIDEFANLHSLYVPLVYDSVLLGRTITVPAAFVTDYASVPRILGVYDLEGGKCNRAAVIHDWLYSTQCVDRATADAVLREAILASGYSAFTANVFYAAVRVGGASHWKLPNVPQTPQVAAAMTGEAMQPA